MGENERSPEDEKIQSHEKRITENKKMRKKFKKKGVKEKKKEKEM